MAHAMAAAGQIYEGEADRLITGEGGDGRIVLLADGTATDPPKAGGHLRILWGQHLIDDLLAGHYRSLVCAVNTVDNSRGLIATLARQLGTSQWDDASITDYARRFTPRQRVGVLKYDMDAVEVLALLRPSSQPRLTLSDLRSGFAVVAEMLRRRTERLPVASVSFLGAHANRLARAGGDDQEPSFEAVLQTMFDAGFRGDVYPAPWMWQSAPTGVFARYPFPESVDRVRTGGS